MFKWKAATLRSCFSTPMSITHYKFAIRSYDSLDNMSSSTTQTLYYNEMSHYCEVVKIRYSVVGDPYLRHGLWVGTNLCIGTLFFTKGSLMEGMTCHREEDYVLVYPSPEHTTEFQGTIKFSRFGDLKRVCERIAPPPKQVNENQSSVHGRAGYYMAEEWVLAVLATLWHDGILEHAIETTKLLENYSQYVDGFTQPDFGKNKNARGGGI